ncbi:MBL fold metallo-hydrolase [Acrocarpospora pleiomorpha]|uniref:MBL fold metallo-hydrolase n=1 Tax=Acrocarpospora pleiomorpha TaxID=90975 RepID=A0A5M3XJZ8_9ACTN|nr:N-acyl homoserine lactonase family protein [Acrocarpospora pleiomorpha]GES21066.1 MBL fold metallo-hydrolase [Acrocarpospora pleiomorpha]
MTAAYEVLAIRYATRTTSRAAMFLNHHVYGEPDTPIDMDFYFWVARNEDHTVVIDTGYGAAGRTGRKRRAELAEPMAALADLGVLPESAPQVIATHAHYDHIGNLSGFPHSEIVIGRAEFDFWTGPYARRQQFAYTTEPTDLTHLREIRDQGRATFVDRQTTVAPGIEVIPVGGHTPGQLIVLIATETGQAVLTSDAAHYYEEIELDRPFTWLTDLEGTYRAYELLRELAAEPGRVLVAGHDPDVMRRFPSDGQIARIA